MNNRQKRELLILIAVICLAAFAGWLFITYISPTQLKETKGAIGQATKRPLIAARVNGSDITNEEVDMYYRSNLGLKGIKEESIPEEMRLEYRYEALELIIEERMLAEGASKLGVAVTKDDADKLFNERVVPNFKDEAELKASLLEDLGLTVDQLKQRLARQELTDRVKAKLSEGATVTDEEVTAEIKSLEKILKSHPGGKVEVPSREEIRKQLFKKIADGAYAKWLDSLAADAKVEVLDPSLKGRPDPLKKKPPLDAEGKDAPPAK